VCKIAKFLERGMSGDTIVYKIYEKKRIYKKATGQAAQVSTTEDTVWVKIPRNHELNNLAGEATAVFDGFGMLNLQANSGVRLTKSFGIVLLYEDYQYEDCWLEIITDGCPDRYEYIEGLGGPYSSCSVAYINNAAEQLVYYKKGQEEWGEPLNIIMLGLQEENAEDYCQLIQKPGEQSFVLQLNGDVLPYEVQLINMNGQLVEQQKINEASWRFENTTGLKGVFIVKLINSKNQVFSRKIVF
ncbi:MAG: T9SS type A sorting domain-containing protein, partial [Bacteroidales bacterium]|nr:T9SS type A sorting domain-containing protein [Bacteroidales bacterium]